MFNLSQETVTSLFKEDVELYLLSNDIYFSKDIKLTGKSGFDHNIDFLIPRSKNKPAYAHSFIVFNPGIKITIAPISFA